MARKPSGTADTSDLDPVQKGTWRSGREGTRLDDPAVNVGERGCPLRRFRIDACRVYLPTTRRVDAVLTIPGSVARARPERVEALAIAPTARSHAQRRLIVRGDAAE